MVNFLTTKQVADTGAMSEITARRLRKRGLGPKWIRLQGTRRILYPAAEFKLWLRTQAQGSAGSAAPTEVQHEN